MITVVIPVGPMPAHKKWLDNAIDSVLAQTHPAFEILLIDDLAGLNENYRGCRTYKTPWRVGVPCAFNFGVALSKTDLVFMLGSDDEIKPDCLYYCDKAWSEFQHKTAYYWVDVVYNDGVEQAAACNAAMVTKDLWKLTGGFPLESSSGACDASLLSIMIGNYPRAGEQIHVYSPKPLYYVRRHEGQDTADRGPWQGVILQTRHIVTQLWKPAIWTENYKEIERISNSW